MLDDLDKELEKRGHKFFRYADDSNIYVKSKRAGERVMQSITDFIEKKLKLKVNKNKSAVARPWKRKFLGFSVYMAFGKVNIRISEESIKRLNQINVGWINYYGVAKCKGLTEKLDIWIRQRLRMCLWKRWKKVKTRYKNLKKLGCTHYQAIKYANSEKGTGALLIVRY